MRRQEEREAIHNVQIIITQHGLEAACYHSSHPVITDHSPLLELSMPACCKIGSQRETDFVKQTHYVKGSSAFFLLLPFLSFFSCFACFGALRILSNNSFCRFISSSCWLSESCRTVAGALQRPHQFHVHTIAVPYPVSAGTPLGSSPAACQVVRI